MKTTDAVSDEMGRALVAKYREIFPGAGFPSLDTAKQLLTSALAANQPDFECQDCIGMKDHGCYCANMGAKAPGGAA